MKTPTRSAGQANETRSRPNQGDETSSAAPRSARRTPLYAEARGPGALPPALEPTPAAPAHPIPRLLKSPGQPLGAGDVRIHTGDAAADSAQAMRARAYTYGRDIVFNRGEFDPHTPAGRALLEHELGHVAAQPAPVDYRLGFQKQPGAPDKFYKEVEDAIASVGNRVGTGGDLRFLNDLLALSEAVEAQKKDDVKALTPRVVAASPSAGAPVDRSEAFVNELVARAFLMGMDAEAARLRNFFRTLAQAPSRRGPTDTKFGADSSLWEGLVARTLAAAKFDSATAAQGSIDALLNTFRIIATEARGLPWDEVVKDRKASYSAGAYNPDTLSNYFAGLIGRLIALAAPIFRGVQALMAAAIADLEAGKGVCALATVKTVLDNKILPAYNTTIGDEKLLNASVEVTRSVFGPAEGKHMDYFDTSKAGEKRSVTINYFDKNQTAGFFETSNPVGHIILTRKKQIAFLEQLYTTANRSAMGAAPLKLESVDDWRNFLRAKLVELQKAGKSNEEAFLAVVNFLSGYLETFTASTPFNIEDVIRQDSENYNKRLYPRNLAGQLIQDCGVFALRTVYMLSLVKDALKLRVRFIYLPVHVGLIITGDGLPTLIAHNNKIYPLDAADLAKERKSWAARDPSKPTTDDQFIGEVAGSYYSPGVDVPFRLEDAPALAATDPRFKEKLQKYYEGTLKKDVLADSPSAGISQFHLEYLRVNKEAKEFHNTVVVAAWNTVLPGVWARHRDKLIAELAKARADKPNGYAAAAKAYLTDLDAALQPVVNASAVLDKSRQGVSTTLGAHPELTAPTATRGYGSRVGFTFHWQQALSDHRAAINDQSNLKDAGKPASITPEFSDPKKALFPIY